MKLQTFDLTNNLELLVTAPECLYDTGLKFATSAGPLRLQAADGKFSIEGEGFLWLPTNTCFFISNRVHTVVQPDLLEAPSSNPRPEASKSPQAGIDIFSHQFDYSGESGLGTYRDEVRVAGAGLSMTSAVMTLVLPMKERQLKGISARDNVTVDYGGVHANGQRVDYSVETGLVGVSGPPAPTWRTELREGGADELIIDRTNRIFHANGHSWLRMPGQSLGASGFLPRKAAPGVTTPGTNEFVEIAAGNYEVHNNSEHRTNWVVFRDQVRVKELDGAQTKGTMDCGLMTVTFSGTNELQAMIAERQVVIQQEDMRLTGGKAVYSITNRLLELTEQPAWQAGNWKGAGEQLLVDMANDKVLVRKGATLRLPAGALGQLTTTSARQPAANNELVEILSDHYAVQRPGNALFEGGVRIQHPRLRMLCDHLTVESESEHGQNRRVSAEEKVTFDLTDEDGTSAKGSGDRVVYSYGVVGGITNDLMTLYGNPAMLVTTNRAFDNKVIVLDRTNHKLAAPPGGWKMHSLKEGATK